MLLKRSYCATLQWVARCLFATLLAVQITGCAPAREVEVPLDRELKNAFKDSETLGRFESIPAQSVLFTNATQWKSFWTRFKIAAPRMDFATNCVFAVFAGQKPSSGYAIEVRRILFQAERRTLHVDILEIEPPLHTATLSVLTFPYDIVIFTSPDSWKTLEIAKQTKRTQ